MNWYELVLYSLAVYRVTRFAYLDRLLDEPRDATAVWLGNRNKAWADKLLQFLECAYCGSVWAAIAAYCYWRWIDWQPPVIILAIASLAMIVYNYTDPEPPCIPNRECPK